MTGVATTDTMLGWDGASLARVGAGALRDLYTSDQVHRAEQERLFSRAWTLTASSCEVGPGRYLALRVGPHPVVLWRDASGRCRAFRNMCRHRGLPLLEDGPGAMGRYITCPYHQWSFSVDGGLVNVPQRAQFPEIDPERLGLVPLPVVEWHGMIFVSPGGEGVVDFDAAVAPLAGRLSEYLDADLVQVATSRYTVACNWKFLVENHIDVYHLWYLHQESLRAFDHRAFQWEWSGRTWWSWEPVKDRDSVRVSLPGLSGPHRFGIGAHLLFPNLMIINGPRYLATYDAEPLGPDRTQITLRVRSRPGEDGMDLVRLVEQFLAEDIKACEQLQVGAASPAFAIGALARDHEAPLGRFHGLLRAELLG